MAFINTTADSLLNGVNQGPTAQSMRPANLQADANVSGKIVSEYIHESKTINPNYKPPKTIATPIGKPPTKIDVKTGAGVPGGFNAASVKIPKNEIAKVKSALVAIALQASNLQSRGQSLLSQAKSQIQGLASDSSDKLKKLNALKSSYQKKLTDMANTPDFKNLNNVIPPPPTLPSIPDLSAFDISPKLPSIPTNQLQSVNTQMSTSIKTTESQVQNVNLSTHLSI